MHYTWGEYLQLYGERGRVELLNRAASFFFSVIQTVMFQDVVLSISKLTDPPAQGKHANLTLEVLLADARVPDHPGLAEKLSAAIAALRDEAEPIRQHRNRSIAHLDHATAMGSPESPLPPLPKDLIVGIIDRMAAIYNMHGGPVEDSEAFFDLHPVGGAERVLEHLRAGVKAREEWIRRVEVSEPNEAESNPYCDVVPPAWCAARGETAQ